MKDIFAAKRPMQLFLDSVEKWDDNQADRPPNWVQQEAGAAGDPWRTP